MPKKGLDWAEIDPLINRLVSEGLSQEAACRKVGVNWGTYRKHQMRLREAVHQSTPKPTEPGPEDKYTLEHPSTPEHPGTLEGHQEVIEDVSQSVPDAPHIGIEAAYQGTPEPPSTPIVHPKVRADDPTMAHSGVPARQEPFISTPTVHPSTPAAEDWDLWTTIKARWQEIETMLADRQAMLSTPKGTPGHTQKKTYVFDVRHIALIEQYAQDHRLELKEVIYAMCEEFFQGRSSHAAEERAP
jgi:hypothetical protein